jgi:hypothetical protein
VAWAIYFYQKSSAADFLFDRIVRNIELYKSDR